MSSVKFKFDDSKPYAVCRVNIENRLTVIPTVEAKYSRRYKIFKTFDTYAEADDFRQRAWAIYLEKKAQQK